MAIRNIDNGDYVKHYAVVDNNKLVQWYQRNVKYKYVLPITKHAAKEDAILI